jgi:hypothetical protein
MNRYQRSGTHSPFRPLGLLKLEERRVFNATSMPWSIQEEAIFVVPDANHFSEIEVIRVTKQSSSESIDGKGSTVHRAVQIQICIQANDWIFELVGEGEKSDFAQPNAITNQEFQGSNPRLDLPIKPVDPHQQPTASHEAAISRSTAVAAKPAASESLPVVAIRATPSSVAASVSNTTANATPVFSRVAPPISNSWSGNASAISSLSVPVQPLNNSLNRSADSLGDYGAHSLRSNLAYFSQLQSTARPSLLEGQSKPLGIGLASTSSAHSIEGRSQLSSLRGLSTIEHSSGVTEGDMHWANPIDLNTSSIGLSWVPAWDRSVLSLQAGLLDSSDLIADSIDQPQWGLWTAAGVCLSVAVVDFWYQSRKSRDEKLEANGVWLVGIHTPFDPNR